VSVLAAARSERGGKFAGEFRDLRLAATGGVAQAPAAVTTPSSGLGAVTRKPATSLLAAALGYARRGWKVFPCNANKKPCTQHGFLDATDDEMTIRRWWGDNPCANIGIATRASGLVVIDEDSYKPDCEAERLGELPDTYTVRTPSGGRHAYFALPASRQVKTGNNRLGRDIDVTNYVLAPPSTYQGKQYEVERDLPVADLPPHLIEALRERQ
jgi:hypothetical protein